MNRSVTETARILGVDGEQVKRWALEFHGYLSPSANPTKGKPRYFTERDVLALIHVAMYWEDHPDLEAIRAGLNTEVYLDDERYRELLYMHTPLFQEPPGDLDETWTHGVLLNGGVYFVELARTYKQSAEQLLNSALQSGEVRDWAYPVLFAYRHAAELYLKILGAVTERTHSLECCLSFVEKRYGQTVSAPIRNWILELDKIDPFGTAFRYADEAAVKTLYFAELWVDFLQFRFAMNRMFEIFDSASFDLQSKQKNPGSWYRT
jgi:hypothetical protein